MKIAKIFFIAAAAMTFAACGSNGSTNAADATEVSQGSEIDALLSEYESLIDDYLSLMKKEDVSMEEATEYSQKCAALAQKLNACKDKMTPEDAARFAALGQKFAAAAM